MDGSDPLADDSIKCGRWVFFFSFYFFFLSLFCSVSRCFKLSVSGQAFKDSELISEAGLGGRLGCIKWLNLAPGGRGSLEERIASLWSWT